MRPVSWRVFWRDFECFGPAVGVGGRRLDDRLERSRAWLIRHNPTVMAVVLAAVGVLFVAEGIHILQG